MFSLIWGQSTVEAPSLRGCGKVDMADMQQDANSKQVENKGVFQNFGITGKLKAVTTDLSHGWKFLATKAKKEVNTLNKKARKALSTYEEGSNVRYDQVYDCDFDTGFLLWARFQKSWVELRNSAVKNVTLAEDVDTTIQSIHKNWKKWESAATQLHDNLVAMPDIVAHVEIAQKQIDAIGEKIFNIERLLLEYEDACERVELEQRKDGEKMELSALVEKRQKAFQELKAKYEMTEEESNEASRVLERQESIEKQQIYQDAFIEQMEKYAQFGEYDKPIAGSAGHDHQTEELLFDDTDQKALGEFLESKEMDSILSTPAIISALQNSQPSSSDTKADKEAVEDIKIDDQSTSSLSPEEDSNGSSAVDGGGDLESTQKERADMNETDDQEDEQWFDSQTVD